MKFQKKFVVVMLTICLMELGGTVFSAPVYAKKITGLKQAARMALQTVKNGDVTEVDRDYERGKLVYEVQVIKGAREYDITYRASDGKMLSYGWEEYRVTRGKGKKVISKNKCRNLVMKEVPNGKIVNLVKKYDDGIPVYKVKTDKKGKRYTLKYHGKTGKLLEYEWELTTTGGDSQENARYIGIAKAKKIALSKAPKAMVIKAKFDRDDGIPVYEVELIRGVMEYEIKIHAKTGKILEIDRDYNGGW
ncbi:MAG: hypothetical protein HFH60_11145 [Lachnospiraceae bacterium]|nr:hypothetical protein [Lachnospiraceae bacterium]MCI9547219.1 hypothetical protein [Lachnospiraceae bacterium]